MTIRMNRHVPAKRPETETPTEMHSPDPEREKHKKMERDADRAAHKAAESEQKHDEQKLNQFTI